MPKLICPAQTLKTYYHAKLIVTFRYPYLPLRFVFFLTLKMSQAVETLKALVQTATPASEMHSHTTVSVGLAHLSHLHLIIYLLACPEMPLLRGFRSVLILVGIYFHLTTN